MEQTLGNRISYHRKRLNLTQDQLAEKLGVTAQAVSKWENDQSCPDINTLPRLAAIFGITTDELLGQKPPVHAAQPAAQPAAAVRERFWNRIQWSAFGFAAWVLFVGILYFCAVYFVWDLSLWDILWPSALVFLGLTGLYPRFSFFRLGCVVVGGYFLIIKLFPLSLPGKLALPILLILWGISLLADALRRKPGRIVTVSHNGQRHTESCNIGRDDFNCSGSFCDKKFLVSLPVLTRGAAEVSFGQITVDLSEVESLASPCQIDADCSFGELLILVPSRFRVRCSDNASFGAVNIIGSADPQAGAYLDINADASFGEIRIQYI